LLCSVMQCVAACCLVLQVYHTRALVLVCVYIVVRCNMLQCGAVWCSMVYCGAVCCSVLQCVAVCCRQIARKL